MLLARREHSRHELRGKLLIMARAQQRAVESLAHPQAPAASASEATTVCAETCVDALLTWLEAHGYLSEQRFVEGRVRIRAHRYGNLRIHQELAAHGLGLDVDAANQLRDSEYERAQQVWARKFGHPPQDVHERARQMRFLVNRGFSTEVIRRVLRSSLAHSE